MELKSGVPDAVVIRQDDQSEIHVQAVVQSGRRHVDTRTWRRGPAGFAPGRSGLTLNAADLEALRQGITELLEASDGGTSVARIVWDDDHGRRLRAEIEPFGTRYVARLGFWQRVRDTWRPADDGVILSADRLLALQDTLEGFRLWISERQDVDLPPPAMRRPGAFGMAVGAPVDPWPPAGPDWLTVEPDRVAFHPRGVRITCTLQEQDARHQLTLCQWRRQDSLWIPEPVTLALTIIDLDCLLLALLRLAERQEQGEDDAAEDSTCLDGSTVRARITGGPEADRREPVKDDQGALFRVERQPPTDADPPPLFELCLSLPAAHLRLLGRALTQSWAMLVGWLSETEREELRDYQPAAPIAGTPSGQLQDDSPDGVHADGTLQVGSETLEEWPTSTSGGTMAGVPRAEDVERVEPSAEETPLHGGEAASPDRSASMAPSAESIFESGLFLSFGGESPTPGTIVLGKDEVCIEIEPCHEDGCPAHQVRLPVRALPKIVTGLEEVSKLWARQARVDPLLLYDQPDCAIYARVGTLGQPDNGRAGGESPRSSMAELRVWTSHTTSDAISFEAEMLADLIEGLHRCLHLLGEPMYRWRIGMQPPANRPLPEHPARRGPIAPYAPLWSPGSIGPPEGNESENTRSPLHASTAISLGVIQIDRHRISLSLQKHPHRQMLVLQWEGNTLELPADRLENLLSDLRALYYEALRGRRGQGLTLGDYPCMTVSVHSQEGQLCLVFQQEIEGEMTSLSFPAREIPTLLDAARAAL